MSSLVYKNFGILNAKNFDQMVTLPLANLYIMMSRAIPWPNTSNSSLLDDSFVELPIDTTDYRNQMARDGIIMQRLTGNDIQPVIPRVDWVANTVYVEYTQTLNLFVRTATTQISGGNVNVTSGVANSVVANGINLSSASANLSPGTLIKVGDETKEIHYIVPNGEFLYVNTNFSTAYTKANVYKITTSDIQYINKFYVRNSYDQVFKCLFNNSGVQSTVMPEISIDGQLPENPYVETSDGYKWKYMYTIPSGLKNKFFTDKFMPAVNESIVTSNAEDGRIDIITITNGGSGYYSGSSVNNYAIATVTGDGYGANVTVDVTNGVITDINIIDGGHQYTTATLTVNDPLQTAIGTDASFKVMISPEYGHGSDVLRELGASYQMISLDFVGSLNGYLPTQNDDTDGFRQMAIVKDPILTTNQYATDAYLPMYTTVYTSTPSGGNQFDHNELVYVGASFENATFTARVVHFDDNTNTLLLNNLSGNVDSTISDQITQKDVPSHTATVYSVTKPDINIFSGEVLYVENRQKIYRSEDQTETIKLVVEF